MILKIDLVNAKQFAALGTFLASDQNTLVIDPLNDHRLFRLTESRQAPFVTVIKAEQVRIEKSPEMLTNLVLEVNHVLRTYTRPSWDDSTLFRADRERINALLDSLKLFPKV